MTETTSLDPWQPTLKLRFVERDGLKILQQMYRQIYSGEYEWRDIPVEKEDAA